MIRFLIVLLFTFTPSFTDEIYHSIKIGALAHSKGIVSSGRESGIDIQAEALFNETLFTGHYTIGTEMNLNGDTSFYYGGLTWEDKFFDFLHLGAFFGFSLHNGVLDGNVDDRRKLGSHVLFREALDIGFYLQENISVSLLYNHYSNLGLAGVRNQGNDNFGVRFGFYY